MASRNGLEMEYNKIRLYDTPISKNPNSSVIEEPMDLEH